MKKLTTMLMLMAGLTFGLPAQAQETDKADGKKGQRGDHRKQIMEKYDTNKDGKLDEEERKKLEADMDERLKARFDSMDTDKNGSISFDEFKAAMKKRMQDGPRKGHKGKKDRQKGDAAQ